MGGTIARYGLANTGEVRDAEPQSGPASPGLRGRRPEADRERRRRRDGIVERDAARRAGIHEPHVGARALRAFQQRPAGPGTRIMSPKVAEDDAVLLGARRSRRRPAHRDDVHRSRGRTSSTALAERTLEAMARIVGCPPQTSMKV